MARDKQQYKTTLCEVHREAETGSSSLQSREKPLWVGVARVWKACGRPASWRKVDEGGKVVGGDLEKDWGGNCLEVKVVIARSMCLT